LCALRSFPDSKRLGRVEFEPTCNQIFLLNSHRFGITRDGRTHHISSDYNPFAGLPILCGGKSAHAFLTNCSEGQGLVRNLHLTQLLIMLRHIPTDIQFVPVRWQFRRANYSTADKIHRNVVRRLCPHAGRLCTATSRPSPEPPRAQPVLYCGVA
jgi:hypothetical protein